MLIPVPYPKSNRRENRSLKEVLLLVKNIVSLKEACE